MMDVDVGDQRTTISLSGASRNLLNPSEAKVVWWTQANYVNDSHALCTLLQLSKS
jgi:hypothetical protein